MTQENLYDATFILDPEKYSRKPEEVVAKITSVIETLGGKIQVSRLLWENMKMASEIKRHKYGTYWLIYYRLNADQEKERMRQTGLNTDILRELVLKVQPELEQVLIENAISGSIHREDVSAIEAADDEEEETSEGTDFVDSIEEE